MWRHKNGSNPATSEKYFKILKQSGGGRVQFLRRTAFHSNRLRRRDFGTYRLQRDVPVPYQSAFSKKSLLFWQTCPKVKFVVSSYFYSTKKSLEGMASFLSCESTSGGVVSSGPGVLILHHQVLYRCSYRKCNCKESTVSDSILLLHICCCWRMEDK